MPLTLEFASRQVGLVFGPEVAWHARLVLHDISRLLLLPFYAAIPAGAWLWGAGRTDEDGKTRIVSSLALRLSAAFVQFMTVFTFFGHKADFLFISGAHRWWGACAALVLATSPVLIVWALISHFEDSAVKLDIFDASETTARETAKFMRVENMQTNLAAAWIAGFSVVLYWLLAIGMSH